jgi:hypothetical protein
VHKLVILIETSADPHFDQLWPQFLHRAESIPGLRREATSRVSQVLFGNLVCDLMHELFFDSRAALQQGLSSPEGQEAGRLLQGMTRGRMVLLMAEHTEDNLENIQRYRKPQGESDAPAQG